MRAVVYPAGAHPCLFFADEVISAHRIARDSLSPEENTAVSNVFFSFWLCLTDSDDEKYGIFG